MTGATRDDAPAGRPGRQEHQESSEQPKYSATPRLLLRDYDPQKRHVYAFEREVLRSEFKSAALFPDNIFVNTRKRMQQLEHALGEDSIESLWVRERDRYRLSAVRPPTVCFMRVRWNGRSKASGAYRPWNHSVAFNALQVTRGCVLHELSHALALGGYQSHGPEFLGTLIGIYIRHGDRGRPVTEILEEAARRGLAVDARWIDGKPALEAA
jgi:hypothetical protein